MSVVQPWRLSYIVPYASAMINTTSDVQPVNGRAPFPLPLV
jgi:hypothetical protein